MTGSPIDAREAATAEPRVWLVRHAPTAWTGLRYAGRSDPPLSPDGLAAAAGLAASLAGDLGPSARIVTSPARRAAATAEAIAAVAGAAPPTIDDRLWEVDFGDVEGRTFDDVQARHPALAAAILVRERIDWPAGESDRQVRRRARAAWRALAADGTPGPTVVVSHGALLRTLLEELGFDDLPSGRALLEPASVIVLARTAGRWWISSVGPGR